MYISSDSCLSSSCFSWISLNQSTIRASSDSSTEETKGKKLHQFSPPGSNTKSLEGELRMTYMNPRQMKTGDLWNSWVQGMKVTPCGFKEAAHGYSATGHPAHLSHGCLNSAPLHDPTNPEKLEPAMMASLAWDPKARSTVAFHSQNSLILNQIDTRPCS